ncbi:unnamed protein product [Effrenium voratum]|nr:unnamed protein product [Effrenium voratum]
MNGELTLGAQGLAALWMTSSQILGRAHPESAISGFTQRPEVPIELLLLSTGCQIAGGPTPALWACGCCFCCTALALALQGYAWSAWSCQLLLRPWWDPEGCPVPGAPLASALLAGSLCSWLPLRRLSRPKWLLAVWVSAAAPQLWAATRQVDSTWLWPAALLVDLLLGVGARPKGACVSTAAEKQSPSWRAGALADLLALALVVVLLAEPPVPEGLLARLAAPGLALTLFAGKHSLLARFLSQPAFVGLGETAYEAIFLCGPLLQLRGTALFRLEPHSAPGFLAFNALLWTAASLLAALLTALQRSLEPSSSDSGAAE